MTEVRVTAEEENIMRSNQKVRVQTKVNKENLLFSSTGRVARVTQPGFVAKTQVNCTGGVRCVCARYHSYHGKICTVFQDVLVFES